MIPCLFNISPSQRWRILRSILCELLGGENDTRAGKVSFSFQSLFAFEFDIRDFKRFEDFLNQTALLPGSKARVVYVELYGRCEYIAVAHQAFEDMLLRGLVCISPSDVYIELEVPFHSSLARKFSLLACAVGVPEFMLVLAFQFCVELTS